MKKTLFTLITPSSLIEKEGRLFVQLTNKLPLFEDRAHCIDVLNRLYDPGEYLIVEITIADDHIDHFIYGVFKHKVYKLLLEILSREVIKK